MAAFAIFDGKNSLVVQRAEGTSVAPLIVTAPRAERAGQLARPAPADFELNPVAQAPRRFGHSG